MPTDQKLEGVTGGSVLPSAGKLFYMADPGGTADYFGDVAELPRAFHYGAGISESGGTISATATGPGGDPAVMDFRLTLESGVAISTSDQTGKGTVFCTPYKGNSIGLYDGAAWNVRTSAEFSVSLVGTTASKPYDVFCYDNAGTPTLELLVWTGAFVRATALAYQDGVLVKSGAPTRRYLGTIYVNSSGGQTDDSIIKRNVWNYYNRANRRVYVLEGTGHSYTTSSWRLWNNSETNNRLEYIIGVAEETMTYFHWASATGTLCLYTDGSPTVASYNYVMNGTELTSAFPYDPAIGFHYMNCYEYNSSSLQRMYIAATLRC